MTGDWGPEENNKKLDALYGWLRAYIFFILNGAVGLVCN